MNIKPPHFFKRIVDTIESVTSIICLILFAGVIIMGTLGILTRYLPVRQPIWLGQMAIFLAVWMYFLGFVIIAKQEEYIFIEYFQKFLPQMVREVIAIIINLLMAGFCIITLVGGWPLQILQRQMMVPSFPLPQNFFSLSVMVSMALILIILVYHTWVKCNHLIDHLNQTNQQLK